MQIHLSPRHLQLTAAIHQSVARHIEHLEGHGTAIIAAHVVLVAADAEKPDRRFTAKVHLAVAGPDIFAEHSENDLYLALERVTEKLARQLEKRKTLVETKHRKTTQRVAERRRVAGTLPRSVRKELQNVRKIAAL